MSTQHVTPILPIAIDSAGLSRSISDWAWLMALGAVTWPWLLRSLHSGGEKSRARLLRRLDASADMLPKLGSWKADAGFLRLIEWRIRRCRPATVVEFGAGASTMVAAQALARHGGGTLLSFDQHEDFARATNGWIGSHGLNASGQVAPLQPAGPLWRGMWYDHAPLPDSIDLLIVDGPPWTIHPLTRGNAECLFDRVAPGGAVLLDDAARPGERIIASVWRKRWPQFRFRYIRSGSKGSLIGVRRRK